MRSTWVGKTSGKQKRRVVYGIKDEERCKFWRKDKANKTKQKQTSLRVRKEVKKLKGKNFSSPSLPVRGLQLHYF